MGAKPKLLYILHQFGHLGGAELQTRLLAGKMAHTFDVAVAWMDLNAKCAVLRTLPNGPETRWTTVPVTHLDMESPAAEHSLKQILAAFAPDIIHFQHILYWPLAAIDIAKLTGAKVVVSLYDYITITPDYAMEGVADPREVFTPAYSLARFGADLSGSLGHRRDWLQLSLSQVHRRVVISNYLRRIVSTIYPLDFQVIEPGIEPFEPLPKAASTSRVRFGFLGSFIRTKGLATLTEAFVKVRSRYPAAQLNIHGGPIPRGQPPSGMRLCGTYSSSDLPRIFSQFDVGMIPSTFAETYSIVLSEMWNAGVPAIVSDLGAMAERVQHGINGLKFNPGDSNALAAAMCWFIENDSWRSWQLPKPRTTDDLARDHLAMYESL